MLNLHGILLLGGQGTRLRAVKNGNKHLLDVNGRPMADYGFELLTCCGASAITAVVCPADVDAVQHLCARSRWGDRVQLVVQPEPAGTADALERCASRVDQQCVATLWGDNLFEHLPAASCASFVRRHGHGLLQMGLAVR
jgi:dTDP-glucose pyrophosphorylase